jgi:phosphate transport system substrate-binding protein
MKVCRAMGRVLRPAALFLWLWLPLTAGAEVLEIPGTGACEVLLKEVADAFNARHPERRVVVPPSVGTVGAMRLISSDQAVLVRVGRPLTNDETGRGLTYLPFARDLVVFAAGAKAPAGSVNISQLVDIYSGKIKNWQELGGPRAPIRLLVRQPGDSSLLIIQKHHEPFRTINFDPAAKVPYTDPDMLALLEKYDYALGWLTFSALKGAKTPIHPLALDGVAPTPENARTGRYKLLEDYALVFKKPRMNNLAESFLDFLFSPEGRIILEKSGALPLPRN